jgi:hypothetical protein
MKTCTLLALCLLIAALPTAATTANFQGSCDTAIRTSCGFDTTRTPWGGTGTTCTRSTVTAYFWDFGDGISAFYPPNQTWVYHFYGSAISGDICLTVFCSDGTVATTCHCFNNQFGVGGCIRPGAGWTP